MLAWVICIWVPEKDVMYQVEKGQVLEQYMIFLIKQQYMHLKRSKTMINSGSSDEKGNSSLLIFYYFVHFKKSIPILRLDFFQFKYKKNKTFFLENASHKILDKYITSFFVFLLLFSSIFFFF